MANDQSNSFNPVVASQPFYMMGNYQQVPTTVFTVNCGEIRPKDEGVRVKISGKVVKRPKTARFLEIKDLNGCTQLVATDDKPDIGQRFQSIPADSYISIIGTVQLRPRNFVNAVSSRIFDPVASEMLITSNFSQSPLGLVKLLSKSFVEL